MRSLNQQINLAQCQLNLVEPLVAKRAVSQMEALKLSQEIAGLRGKLTEVKTAYSQDAYTERANKQANSAHGCRGGHPVRQAQCDELPVASPGESAVVLSRPKSGTIRIALRFT